MSRSNVIAVPAYVAKKRVYVTSSGGKWHPGDIALAFAMCARLNDSADELRKTAWRIVEKVCLESQPNMRKLAREKDDAKVWNAALKLIDRSFEIWLPQPDCTAEQRLAWQAARVTGPFLRNEPVKIVEPPRCHMKPMRLAGYHEHRHWKCQHCKHTKALRQEDIHGA